MNELKILVCGDNSGEAAGNIRREETSLKGNNIDLAFPRLPSKSAFHKWRREFSFRKQTNSNIKILFFLLLSLDLVLSLNHPNK